MDRQPLVQILLGLSDLHARFPYIDFKCTVVSLATALSKLPAGDDDYALDWIVKLFPEYFEEKEATK